MSRQFSISLFAVMFSATTAAAQPPVKVPSTYDPSAERTYDGIVATVVSVNSPDGTVGVHLDLKTATGTVMKVHLGPAMFIGMNDFFFQMDDQILVKGAWVTHDGEAAFWARAVSKNGKTLTLRGPDGTPRWPLATAEDPDGCGVPHAPVRY
jgi:hypothetical protein